MNHAMASTQRWGPSGEAHHAVAPQQQRRDLADGRRVAVVVAGQVPSAPPAVSHAVLAVVPGAEDPVETEEQQNQQDAGRQAQSRHPGWSHIKNAVRPRPPENRPSAAYWYSMVWLFTGSGF